MSVTRQLLCDRFKNGEEILDEERRKIVQGNLVIANALASDVGEYSCRLEDEQRRIIAESLVELRSTLIF